LTGNLYIDNDDSVGYSLKSSSRTGLPQALAIEIRAVYRALKLRVREHGGGKDLTPSRISVLVRLEKNGAVTVSSLAREEGMRSQSMREIVMPLQEAGFIIGSPDPNDGRQTLLSLTPKCLKWIREGRAASHDWLSTSISKKLSVQEQQKLLDALGLMRRLVGE
jgi:DNA-binding MarR family transcriptional regulator